MLFFARILLTIAAVQYGLVPLVIDLSPSHVFHNEWPPHARFHMVWLLSLSVSVGSFVVWLIWWKSTQDNRYLRIACIPGFMVLGSFFVATMLIRYYGGALADPAHQISIAGIDGNLFAFSIALALQVAGTVLICSQRH